MGYTKPKNLKEKYEKAYLERKAKVRAFYAAPIALKMVLVQKFAKNKESN